MLLFKACPRCGGDVKSDKDPYGSFLSCLQCGWIRDIDGKGGTPRWMERMMTQVPRSGAEWRPSG